MRTNHEVRSVSKNTGDKEESTTDNSLLADKQTYFLNRVYKRKGHDITNASKVLLKKIIKNLN